MEKVEKNAWKNLIKRVVVEALSEQTSTGDTITSNIHAGEKTTEDNLNLTDSDEEPMTRFEQYQRNSFWIFHIGPEICLTLLACILFVSSFVWTIKIPVYHVEVELNSGLFIIVDWGWYRGNHLTWPNVQIMVLCRFVYECDFALDFGFYESGYRAKPAMVRHTPLRKKIQQVEQKAKKVWRENSLRDTLRTKKTNVKYTDHIQTGSDLTTTTAAVCQ